MFGDQQHEEARNALSDANDEAPGSSRILLAGRRDKPMSDVRSALEAARAAIGNRFVVLERSGQQFMQCLCKETGWILEKREGDEERHFRALAINADPERDNGDDNLMVRIFSRKKEPSRYLDFGQVLEALNCYHEGEPEPDWLEWERIEVE